MVLIKTQDNTPQYIDPVNKTRYYVSQDDYSTSNTRVYYIRFGTGDDTYFLGKTECSFETVMGEDGYMVTKVIDGGKAEYIAYEALAILTTRLTMPETVGSWDMAKIIELATAEYEEQNGKD